MSSLPELSLAAAVRAVDAARLGDARRSARALAAADRLAASEPETAFAAAEVYRQQGSSWKALVSVVEGYARGWGRPLERRLTLHNVLLWLLMAVTVGGCLFVVLLMAVRGPALFGSLLKPLRRVMPMPLAMVLLLALLLWPIALSGGVLLIALNWSILLWAYAQRSERWVLALLWIVFGVVPLLLDEQRRRVAVELAPATRAAEAVRRGELEGGLFADLERLLALLPESPAALQLVADQYRRAGQCDRAMELYGQVVEKEPRNAGAWIDLGSCHYLRGEYEQAIEYFRRGTSLDEEVAQGHFNLSLAHSELYDFAESERALARAQRLDSSGVAVWLEQVPTLGVAEVAGGAERAREIRRELRRSWILEDDSAAMSTPLEEYASLPIAGAGLLLCFVAARLLPRSQIEAQAPPLVDWGSRWSPGYRVLLPGLAELEAGESIQAFLAVLVLVALLLVPWIGAYGYRLPWGFDPGIGWAWPVTIVGLALFYLARWRKESLY